MIKRFATLSLVTMLPISLGACSVIPDSMFGASEPAAARPAVARSSASVAQRPTPRTNRGLAQSVQLPAVTGGRCVAELGTGKANFTPLPDKYYGAGCATVDSVQLVGVQGDARAFQVSNLGPVACPLAEKFAGWARYGVDRAAKQILGASLVRIETLGSYSCRNIAGSSRRSAHATGEAIDVSAFVLSDGRRITLQSDWDGGSADERQFLRTVQESACKRFGTVLGPQYNAAHRDHFHLELEGGRYCR